MAYWIYSSESLPNPEMMGRPGYNPDNDYIRWHGVHLGVVLKDKWTKLPDFFTSYRRASWRSPKEEYEVPIRVFKPMIESSRFAEKGVIILDHEPTPAERETLQARSRAANMAFRMKVVENFEQERTAAIGRQGRLNAGPYENECYEILGIVKPYSVEAMRAQRHPGEAVGEQIVSALDRLLERKEREAREAAAIAPLPQTEKPKAAATK